LLVSLEIDVHINKEMQIYGFNMYDLPKLICLINLFYLSNNILNLEKNIG